MVTQAQIVKELEDGGRIERVRDGTDSDKQKQTQWSFFKSDDKDGTSKNPADGQGEDEEGNNAKDKSSDGRDGKSTPTSKESTVRKKELGTDEQGDANFSRVNVELLDFDWIFDGAEDGTEVVDKEGNIFKMLTILTAQAGGEIYSRRSIKILI